MPEHTEHTARARSGGAAAVVRSRVSAAAMYPHLPFLGTRMHARDLRFQVEARLAESTEVEVSFDGIAISQAFADELVGVMLLQHGPDILQRLVFKGCSNSVKGLIEFVVADRYDEYMVTRAH